MSEEKFTKGVWKVGITYPCLNVLYGYPAVWNNDFCIAQMCDLEESAANAHLIAAAPEMYGLLKRLLTGGCLVYGEDIDSVEDLLAKARGES